MSDTPAGAGPGPDEESRSAGRPRLRPSEVRRAAAAAAGGGEPPAAWRVTFAYEGSSVRVVERSRVATIAPPDDSALVAAGTRGSWAEVRDAEGHVLYAQVLHQPIRSDYEVHNRRPGTLGRHVLPDEVKGAFEVLVPDLPGGVELVVRGRADIADAAAKAPRQLVKTRLVEDEGPR